VFGVALLAALLTAVLAGCGSDHVDAPQGVGTELDGSMPAAIEGIPLVDSTGKVHHLGDFRGKVVVLQDSMTLCQETCPMDTATLVRAARAVDAAGEGDKVVFLTVTVDPQRDTVPQLRAYRKLYGGPANWLTLTGAPRQVDRLWSFLGVYRKKVPSDSPVPRNWRTGKPLTYDVQHADEVFFFDTRGHERFILSGMPHASRGELPKRLYHFLSSEGRQNLRKGDWTLGQALAVTSWLLDHRLPGSAG
jgi:protein SCO1/2